MNRARSLCLLIVALLLVACGGSGQPTTPLSSAGASPAGSPRQSAAPTAEPATGEPATPSATVAPSEAPSASLDPSRSDAGIVARVTISQDTLGGRDGTHDIYGVAEDGSECSGAFEEPEYIVVAWYDDAPNGLIHRFGISVAADDLPTSDGATTGIEDGGVSFSFASESGLGTQYTGNATEPDEGSVTIDMTRAGASLTFDFDGVTNAGVTFVGQLICADA